MLYLYKEYMFSLVLGENISKIQRELYSLGEEERVMKDLQEIDETRLKEAVQMLMSRNAKPYWEEVWQQST